MLLMVIWAVLLMVINNVDVNTLYGSYSYLLHLLKIIY